VRRASYSLLATPLLLLARHYRASSLFPLPSSLFLPAHCLCLVGAAAGEAGAERGARATVAAAPPPPTAQVPAGLRPASFPLPTRTRPSPSIPCDTHTLSLSCTEVRGRRAGALLLISPSGDVLLRSALLSRVATVCCRVSLARTRCFCRAVTPNRCQMLRAGGSCGTRRL